MTIFTLLLVVEKTLTREPFWVTSCPKYFWIFDSKCFTGSGTVFSKLSGRLTLAVLGVLGSSVIVVMDLVSLKCFCNEKAPR